MFRTVQFCELGSLCAADLWVSPDGNIIAFISIERLLGVDDNAKQPDSEELIEKSSIYVARRDFRFCSTEGSIPIFLNGRKWSCLRDPRLSPDGKMIYFSIPYTMTTSRIQSISLVTGRYEDIGDAISCCITWHGPYDGGLLMLKRIMPRTIDGGITYSCYLRRSSKEILKVSESCLDFDIFSKKWSKSYASSCN